jgi:hypothetical protein
MPSVSAKRIETSNERAGWSGRPATRLPSDSSRHTISPPRVFFIRVNAADA